MSKRVKATILQGDVVERLRDLEDQSVNLIVTSPPYFNARMYFEDAVKLSSDAPKEVLKKAKELKLQGIVSSKKVPKSLREHFIPAEIGMELTPRQYINALVEVFREATRVLRDDGNMYINVGDAYCAINGFERASAKFKRADSMGAKANTRSMKDLRKEGFQEKSLFLIPSRLAIALQKRLGLIIRAEIIWFKPNAQPSVVKDRVSTSHELIYHVVKKKKYQYDYKGSLEIGVNGKPRNRRSVWICPVTKYRKKHIAPFPYDLAEIPIRSTTKSGDVVLDIFSGSGTTGIVALALNRSYIGIELNPNSVNEQKERISEERFQGAKYKLKWKRSKKFRNAHVTLPKYRTEIKKSKHNAADKKANRKTQAVSR